MTLFNTMRTNQNAFTYSTSEDAQSQSMFAQRRVDQLEEQLDKLTLVCAAMWDLLKEKQGFSDADLSNRVAVVDARDGTADGKLTHAVHPCPECGRPMAPKYKKCLYCGAEQPSAGIFESL
jgi:hypothetical protein